MRSEFGDDVEIKEVKAGPDVPWPFSTLTGSAGLLHMGIGGASSPADHSGEPRVDLMVDSGGGVRASIPASAIGSVTGALQEQATEAALWERYRVWT